MTMRLSELRPALYHRFHRLLPLLAHPAARRLWRVAVWGFWLVYFGFVLLVLALRYAILPQIENYRGDIERLAGSAIGLPVTIGRIEAGWDRLRPQLSLYDVRISDAQGRPALALTKVDSVLSWSSLPHLQLRQHLMQIDEPTLHVRREADGRLYVAGIPVNPSQGDGELSAWLLVQQEISIRGATIVWEDALRQAPQLVLEDVGLSLRNSGRRHRFGLTALPPEALASRLDLRGDLRGSDPAQLDKWQGQFYAAIDYADLAAWRQWFDYPFALPQGRGAVRAWVGVGAGKLRQITADVALHDVRLRLAKDLPEIDLDRLEGRLGARLPDGGFEVSGQRLELATRDGLQVAPTDFHIDWQPESSAGSASSRVRGSATASEVDLGVLAAIAGHLPLDAHTRQLLQAYAPRGRVAELRASWRGDAEALQSYTLKARFDGLGLQAQGHFPGFLNLNGKLEASEKGGNATLHSTAAAVDLPGVFPEPRIALDTLNASAKWKVDKGVLDAELSHVDFASADAAGSAEGTYRYSGDGPGRIDLKAALSRADARAVWRYMPNVVGAGARDWLRRSLTAGTASEAKLVLKGDLAHFPFLDKSQGQFLVTVKAQGVTIDYASSWPKITDIAGDVRFEGAGMVVDARQGNILGARIAHARAEIPDFDAAETMLLVKGRAAGPTAEFLKFIEASPVGDKIDHFTADMSAGGNGQLDLGLKVPLNHAVDASLAGDYQFIANQVGFDPGLPPLTQVNGRLQFTGNDLRVPEINASLLGSPVRINARTQPDGRVLVAALGTLNIAQLKKQFDLPLLDHLSGSAAYRGEVRVKKRSADLVIDSNLVGIASSLPAPFNKSATEPWALHFEKAAEPAPLKAGAATAAVPRDRISLALGKTAAVQIVRRKQGDGYAVERGAVAVGEPLAVPDSGLRLGVTAPRIDLDFWRQALRPGGSSGAAPADEWLPLSVSLKTADLALFGRALHEVEFRGGVAAGGLKAQLKSREVNGDLWWEGLGRGKLTARLKNLSLDTSAPPSPVATEALDQLPALDVIADEFKLGARRFGRLEVQAKNEGSVWLMDKVAITNASGSLVGSGRWQVQGGNRTQLEFRLDSNDVGKLLERLDYPGAVRGGSAKLSGKLGWHAGPTALDYPTLAGEMRIESAKGQFAKLDTGAGKLLGLLSLQSLPRRITLDFRDVFSEGFAYDSIAGDVTVKNGVMHTDRLQIDGPAARILMRGDADLKQETQNLRVSIQPELGGPAAAGLALVHPIAGVAALLAHKILQNPLNQIFAFDYQITGQWDDPKVEKVGPTELTPPAATQPPTSTPGAAHDATQH